MYRNKELIYYGLVQILIMALFVVYGIWFTVTYVTLLQMGVVFLCTNFLFMYYRYTKIRKLNEYLQKIQNNDYTLDIRDNQEGELSILKNEMYKITKMLSNQTELLQRDKRYLSDSISDISHQLKTPLTSMSMMIELMEEENLPLDKRMEFTNNISKGLERMEWLIQSLLKLSKLDADAVQLKSERIQVYQLLDRSIQNLSPLIEEKKVDIIIKGQNDIYIYGDGQWLIEAVTNILKNSIEHMSKQYDTNELDKGHATSQFNKINQIKITIIQNNLYTKIIIEDNGTGIEKEDIPYIFQRFYKGKHSKSDSVGIGLALSKQIIHRHRGSIEVISDIGKGTIFELKLYSDKAKEGK